MTKRARILAGMALGAFWSGGVLVIGRDVTNARLFDGYATELAYFLCGLVLLAMIGRLAQRRFFDDAIIDGQTYLPDTPAEIDQRVLQNTVEQLVLAAFLWPLIGKVLGDGMVLTLALSFVIARLTFWIGYHLSPPLRAFGFAATFYPTILVAVFAMLIGWSLGFFSP